MKKIALLGSTGSIGTQTLEVVDELKTKFKIEIISAHKNYELVLTQVLKYNPKIVILTDKNSYNIVKSELYGKPIKVLYGIEGILNALEEVEVNFVVGAISGAAGIKPTLKALELGIDVALANKETIVAAGDLVRKLQEKTAARIIPVDSEHSAIMQCFEEGKQVLKKIILTASGGPFRNYSKEALELVTPEKALKHPNWSMGQKITIDSATMMNKGLEVIEAHWLFNVDYADIKVVIHPQSIIHSMVEYGDGSVLAHLGLPDMRIPIQYALTYPRRMNNSFPKLDLTQIGSLEFYAPDLVKFPSLQLAYEAGKIGYTMPAVLNASNEVAVELFLKQKISFTQIPLLVERVLKKHTPLKNFDLETLEAIDTWSREESKVYKF